MATFSLTDTVRRFVGTGDGSNVNFDFPFQVNATTDVKVYVDDVLQTVTTHFTVVNSSNVAGLNADGTGRIRFVTAPANQTKVSVISDLPLSRSNVYTSGGNITSSALEADFDTLQMKVGDADEQLQRSLKAPPSELTNVDMTIPSLDARKGKLLAFNATSGEPEAGPEPTDVTTLAAVTSDIGALADVQDGTLATNGLSTLAGISSDITTVAGVSSEVTTVAGQTTALTNVTNNLTAIQNAAQNATDAASAKTAAELAQQAAEAALDTFDDRFLGAKNSDPNQDNDGNALLDGALYFDTTANLMKVYDQSGSQWVQLALTGTNQTNVNTVAGQISPTNNISAVAGAIGDGTFANATTFVAKYRTGTTDPTDSLDSGDLFFNTTSNTLKVYNGSGWVDATLQGATITTFEYTATAGQTVFTGNDANGDSLNYNTVNVLVTINGVIIPSSDYTTTSATTLTLDADAAADVGDTVFIISYSEFSANTANILADTSPQLGGNLDVNGNSIVSTSNGDINITPNGTGKVKVDNLSFDGNTIAAEDTNGDIILAPNGDGDVEINLENIGSVVSLNYDDPGNVGGPTLVLNRTSSSTADGDDIGRIFFKGTGSTGTQITFASIHAEMDDVSASTPNGSLKFDIAGDSPASGAAALELMTELGTNTDGIVRFGNEPKIVWVDHKGTTHDCTLDWETPTQANTVKLPNATGTIGYVAISTTTITSETAAITLDNLPDEFDTFQILINAHPVSDAVDFRARFIKASDGAVLDLSNSYGYYRDTDGSNTSSDNSSVMQITGTTIGSADYEGVAVTCHLQGRNFTTSSVEVVPPTIQGTVVGHYNTSVSSGGNFYGMMNDNNVQAIRGIEFYFSSGNVARATVQIFGIQNT